MNKEDKVYVPKNVKKQLEFFRGFGVKELIITLIVGVLSIIPTILLYKYGHQAFALTLFLVVVATTIMLVIKDDNNVLKAIGGKEQLDIIIDNLIDMHVYEYKIKERQIIPAKNINLNQQGSTFDGRIK